MANYKTVLENGTYKIENVGPSSPVSFPGKDGQTVNLTKYTVKFEGQPQWFEINQKPDAPAPEIGQTLTGWGEQDDEGKYAPKFKKESKGGFFGGGSKNSPGAAWANAVQTSAQIVTGYYAASGSKPKDFEEFFGRVKAVAPDIKKLVDDFVGTDKPAETAQTTTDQPTQAQAKGGEQEVDVADFDENQTKGW